MIIKDITTLLECFAPAMLQEDYDNAGLIVGNKNHEVHGVLISVDMTENVLQEAISKKYNLIITHHPLIFKGLKRLNGNHYSERIVMDAIRNNIAIYAIHTNIDSVTGGVSSTLASKLGLANQKILSPRKGLLKKLVTFVPVDYLQPVRDSLFEAGAGHIGNYDNCSFQSEGLGSFRANEKANPFVGKLDELHVEKEVRIETIFPAYVESQIIAALISSHPYEEVAYDIYSLENEFNRVGFGVIGDLEGDEGELEFLQKVKEITAARCLKHTSLLGRKPQRIAVCGGSGAFLIREAMASKADIYITGDLKYHDYFEADGKIVLVDIGHYESEQFVCEVISSVIKEKFPNFANFISVENTNPVNCLK